MLSLFLCPLVSKCFDFSSVYQAFKSHLTVNLHWSIALRIVIISGFVKTNVVINLFALIQNYLKDC